MHKNNRISNDHKIIHRRVPLLLALFDLSLCVSILLRVIRIDNLSQSFFPLILFFLAHSSVKQTDDLPFILVFVVNLSADVSILVSTKRLKCDIH